MDSSRKKVIMKLEHIAVYVKSLEETKDFYVNYFGAVSNNKYSNPKTKLETYFLSFGDGARLEIMSRPNLLDSPKDIFRMGLIHIAFKLGSAEKVDSLTKRIEKDGFKIISYPRTTGDGYYESCIADPEGNYVEIIA